MGFGHRVYKSYDPRAKIIKQTADEVFEVTGRNPLLDIALELERIALEDDYFISRKLYPNVDFYSGLIYQAMGFPMEMFPVLFAIPRTAGWIAQWEEMLLDQEQKIARPRQVYIGRRQREFVPRDKREAVAVHEPASSVAQLRRSRRLTPSGTRRRPVEDLVVRQDRRRRLGAGEDAVDERLGRLDAAPLAARTCTFDRPDIGPTSISCSRPTSDAGTLEYTASASATSFLRNALTTAAAWTPVAVRNASRPTTG